MGAASSAGKPGRCDAPARTVVAVVDPRPLVRSALVEALTATAEFEVRSVVETTAVSLRAVGSVDVVVAGDHQWARRLPWLNPEPFDVAHREALAAAVRSLAAAGNPGNDGRSAGSRRQARAVLTSREAAVMECLVRGLTAVEAATELRISVGAVGGAKRRILSKLEVATLVEAMQALNGRGEFRRPESEG